MKEETLEEAAEKWLNKDGFNEFNHYDTRPSFIEGAQWQAERMYSEKEIVEIIDNFLLLVMKNEKKMFDIFNEFKKK